MMAVVDPWWRGLGGVVAVPASLLLDRRCVEWLVRGRSHLVEEMLGYLGPRAAHVWTHRRWRVRLGWAGE